MKLETEVVHALRFAVLALAITAPTLPSIAHAQGRVILMADPALREPLAAALRVELASRGTEVLVSDRPVGDTRVARASSAQASARAVDALGAVWSDTIEGAAGAITMVRVAPSADSDARQAPLPTSEPRAFALVAASLLEELLGPPEPAPAALTEIDLHAHVDGSVDIHVAIPAGAPGAAVDAPLFVEDPGPPVDAPAPVATLPTDEMPAPALLGVYGGVAVGGLVLASDGYTNGGPLVRGAFGLRILEALRIAVEPELAAIYEDDRESFQSLFRLGLTCALEMPVVDEGVAIVVGGHVRAAFSTFQNEWRGDELTLGIDAGGTIGVLIPIADAMRLDVAVEVDGLLVEGADRVWVAPALVVGIDWL